GSLTAMRLFSVLLGAGIIVAAWLLIRLVFPTRPVLAFATAAFVAFLPQHVAMMAGVDNDSLAELIVALTLFACVVYLQSPTIPHTGEGEGTRGTLHPFLLGLLMGVAFLTKITAMAPVMALIGVTVVIRTRREAWTLQRFVREAVWIALPALAL